MSSFEGVQLAVQKRKEGLGKLKYLARVLRSHNLRRLGHRIGYCKKKEKIN